MFLCCNNVFLVLFVVDGPEKNCSKAFEIKGQYNLHFDSPNNISLKHIFFYRQAYSFFTLMFFIHY